MDASQVYNEWKNRIVFDSGGEKLGTIDDVYLDRDTKQPEWGLISMGLFGSRHTLVPLTDAQVDGNRVQVPFDAERVRTAPVVEPQGELSEDQEKRLYQHYGVSSSKAPSESRLPDSSAGMETPGDGAGAPALGAQGGRMQLREEQLDVQKKAAPVGEVRLGKSVVTERRELDVPVLREILVLERRTVRRRPRQQFGIGEAPPVVVPLSRERVEIVKRPMVREEVAVSKTSRQETEHVGADLMREVPRIEKEGDVTVTGDVAEEAAAKRP